MPRRARSFKKRIPLPDPKFGSTKYAKFINHLMYGGKKTVAQKMIFSFDKTQIFADVIIDDKPSLTAGKEDIRFNHWAIVDHLYNRSLPENTKLLPIARIKNDWSNCDEVFAQLGLI
jgi:hypothetical protein